MTQERVTTFVRRLNVVLRNAGWPEVPIVDEPEPSPQTRATIFRDSTTEGERFRLRLERSDDPSKVVRIESNWTPRDLVAGPLPQVRVPNDLVRRTKWALA